MRPGLRRSYVGTLCASAALVALVVLSGTVVAHSGSLRGATQETLAIPTWLFLLTGGGAVGASFLLSSFVTDRVFIGSIRRWGRTVPMPGRLFVGVGRVAGVVLLVGTLYVGFVGPPTGVRNLAILVVWVGWWGGYVASAYLVGNSWPAVNPFRTLASLLPTLDLTYPERLGVWPSVVGILVLVWIEVVTPLADDPTVLVTILAGYTVVTLCGAVAFGVDRWFDSVDPISRLFRVYGSVAPIQRTDDGLRVCLPGTALEETRLSSADEVAFVVAVLFVTTYDGFVATGLWETVATAGVDAGFPATAVYLLAFLGGFAVFWGVYRWAARAARRYGESYLSVGYLARRFAPSLLAIAAGYHLAHNLGAFLTLSPTLLSVAANPLAPPQNPPQLVGLPGWFGGVELGAVLLGHLLAVWVAHATSYDLFPGRLQAIRSQYGVTLVMVMYTMVSLWIVSEPYVAPPFLGT
ncbi:MAG: hypothetical protein ACQETI_03870 [Halobacteriota archaeon]